MRQPPLAERAGPKVQPFAKRRPSSGRPASGLSVLAALAGHAVGRDQLGCHQPHSVAMRLELARPVVRRPEQASMTITLGGTAAIIAPSLARATLCWRSSTDPPRFTPCTANTFLAKSIPVAIMVMGLPLPSELMKVCTSYLGTASQCYALPMTRGREGTSIRYAAEPACSALSAPSISGG